MMAQGLFAALLLAAPASLAITDVTLLSGDGGRIERTTVVVTGGKIAAIGATAPPGAQILDGKDRVLTPGLIELRSRFGLVEIEAVREANDADSDASMAPAFYARDGFNPDSVWFSIARAQGITTAVAAPHGGVIFGHGALFDLGPDRPRPTTMFLFGAVDEHAARAVQGSRSNVWRKLRELLADATYYRDQRRAVDEGRARPLALAPQELMALWPVIAGDERFIIDAERRSDIEQALAFAAEHKLKIAIAGAAEGWLVAEALARARVPVILVPSEQVPASFEKLQARDDSAALLEAAGVPLVISAYGAPSPARLRQEAGIAAAYGLDRAAALRAITLEPARVLGRERELGTVAVGKRANLVLWSGDPLEPGSRAVAVLIDGVPMPLRTRQRALAERYLPVVKAGP